MSEIKLLQGEKANDNGSLDFIPGPVQNIVVKGFKKMLSRQGVKSLILIYDKDKEGENIEGAFNTHFFENNIYDQLSDHQKKLKTIEAEYNKLKSRNAFLEDFRNQQLNFPLTRKKKEDIEQFIRDDKEAYQIFAKFLTALQEAEKNNK